MTTTTDHGERLARLEGAYEHLATKADIADLRTEIERLSSSLTWRMIVIAVLAQALGIGVLKYLP